MSSAPSPTPFSARTALRNVLAALKELGGFFVFTDEEGQEFIVLRRQDFEARTSVPSKEQQLSLSSLPARPASAGDVLDRINREIAIYQVQEQEEEIDDLALVPRPPRPAAPKRVRFEPLRGDISPDLQE